MEQAGQMEQIDSEGIAILILALYIKHYFMILV